MAQKLSQSGELDAEPAELEAAGAALGAETIKDQLADIRDKVEQQKIPLTKEVEVYTREHLRKVAGKLQAGEPVYPSDMEFIGKVELWLWIPANVRDKYQSIEDMENELPEAEKRSITLKQWFALLHIAGLQMKKGMEMYWINREAQFPGNGEIRIRGPLILKGAESLTDLPDNLCVEQWMSLEGCTGLTTLPRNLKVNMRLSVRGCTGLKSLPASLQVGDNLYLSNDNEQIIQDADKLKKEGKVLGSIYIK